jgi:TonB-linked SusC/RagA family outer membrane protein
VRYANGNYGQVNGDPATSQYNYLQFNIFNPLSVLELTEDNEKAYRIQNNLNLEYELFTGLKVKTQLGMTFGQSLANFYLPATLASEAGTAASLTNPILNNIRAKVTNSRAIDYLWENTATYTKSIGDHTFNGLLLYSQQKYTSTASIITGVNGTFTNDLIHNPTAAATINGSLGYGLNSFVSYAGRINYDYKAKYILSAALRRDGSSRFGTANRFGYFPSVSSSWRISEENFFYKIKPIVNEFKLRASYGRTGNAGIGDFTWQNNIAQGNYSFGNTRQVGAGEAGFLSTDLTWEKNNQVDLGAEFGFLKDRIYLNVDWYKKTTDGMLFNRGLPAIVGYASSFTTNIGSMWNKGLELALSTKNLIGDFKWQTDFNISFNRNKVTYLDGRQELDYQSAANWANVYRIKVGDPIGNIYGLKMLGVYNDQADLDASPKWIAGSQVGDYKALDANGDGVVSNDDYVVLGNGLPDFTYGITNRISFKSFDALVVLQGTNGNSIVNGATRHSNVARGVFNGITDLIDNYYLPSKENGDAKYARPNYSGLATPAQFTSYAIEDGSFLRIRTVTVGYNLPASVAKKLKLNSLRVYLSGLNLYTFTKYPGYNPEPSLEGNSAYTPGVDLGTYPSNRTMSIGLNIGF